MSDYRYITGQSVRLLARMGARMPSGPFNVIRLLPADNRGNHYHLKSLKDGHERVAAESELSPLPA